MTQSRLIELSYYDPSAQVRLSAYADTVVLDHNSKGGIISAVRFGGYPEMVRAMSDAIYGGATIEATQNSTTRMLQSNVKGYQRQMSHDGVYAVATLMASDDAQTDDRASEGDGEVPGYVAVGIARLRIHLIHQLGKIHFRIFHQLLCLDPVHDDGLGIKTVWRPAPHIGPFDTEEELFNALKEYTDTEVEAGTMSQAEATALLEKYQ